MGSCLTAPLSAEDASNAYVFSAPDTSLTLPAGLKAPAPFASSFLRRDVALDLVLFSVSSRRVSAVSSVTSFLFT